jgi:phage tail sheath protein FI
MPVQSPAPGVVFTIQRKPDEPSPLRSDVAAFAGPTRRGPVGMLVRVEGWRECQERFGGLRDDLDTPYAMRAYFDNGGDVAWIIRLAGDPLANAPAKTAGAAMPAGLILTSGGTDYFSRIEATSPGTWANGARIGITYRRAGIAAQPEVDLVIDVRDEPREYLRGLNPAESDSWPVRLVRFIVADPDTPFLAAAVGPREAAVQVLLGGGVDPVADRVGYLDALRQIAEEAEIALVCLPELQRDPSMASHRDEILESAVQQAEDLHDRLVLLDLPSSVRDASAAIAFANDFRTKMQKAARAAVLYHPRVKVSNPLAEWEPRVRTIASIGPTAGLISRLDRTRGAHFTPANATLDDVLDVTQAFDERERGELNAAGVNILRCIPGKGIQVWGGRTLGDEYRFLAHRRLVHRLVRAIRRVAAPLVFDINGPELWLMIVRSITTLLLQLWRAGALKGARPQDAFVVRCDETTNIDVDNGLVVCEIQIAPAAPMEFITLRIALGQEGTLEVFES